MQTKKIKIKKETYNRLTKKGNYGDTIDDILNRILDRIELIEMKNKKTPAVTNTIMKLTTTNRQYWNSPLFNS